MAGIHLVTTDSTMAVIHLVTTDSTNTVATCYVCKETANDHEVNDRNTAGSNKIFGNILKHDLYYACPNVPTPI